MLFEDFKKISFTGVTGAFFGSGDQFGYSCNYLDAVGILAREFIEKGGNLVGKWPTEGYEFDESIALEDGKFLVWHSTMTIRVLYRKKESRNGFISFNPNSNRLFHKLRSHSDPLDLSND